MTWTYVGKGVFDTNTPASPPYNINLPAGTQSGDVLIMHVTCRGNYNLVPPTGWTSVHAVNNNDTTAGFPGKPTVMVAYIIRGAGTPATSMSIPAVADRTQCTVVAYRPSAGTVSYVGATTLSETTSNSTHTYPQHVGLLSGDLLVLTAGHGAVYSVGAADAVNDPSTASPAHTANVDGDGAMSTAAPTSGAWLNRHHQYWSAGTDGGSYIADGVKSVDGDTGAITFNNAVGFVVAGAVLAFRHTVSSPDTITINDPVDKTVYEGASGSRSITFSGSHTGATSTIQIQIERTADSSVAVAWTTLATSVAAGTFSGSITVPRGGWYIAKVRKVSDNAITDSTSTTFGVGVVLGGLGQSHLEAFSTSGTAGATNPLVVTHTGSAITLLSTAGAAQMAMCAAVASAFACPVMWIQASAGGTNVTYWYSSGGGATAQYNAWAAKVTAAGGKLSAFIWWQGDFNTLTGDTKSTYTTLMSDLVGKVRLDFTATYCIVGILGRKGGGDDTAWQAIRSAHVDFSDNTNNLGWNTYDLEQQVDQQHFTDAANLVSAARIANCVAKAYGLATYSRGPVVLSAVYNGTTLDVTVSHEGGSDFTPTTGVTGFRVLDNTTPITVSAAVRQSASVVRLTLASAPAGTVTLYHAFGAYPTVTGVLKDNSALTLPLMPTDGAITVPFGSLGGGAGTITTDPVKNYAGTVLASTTIPKLTFVRISDGASVLTLTNQVTNGSGVLTINHASLVAGVAYLVIPYSADGSTRGAKAYTAV